jgi:hypothetical protein
MTNVQMGLLYFSVVVSALYLVAGGYKSIRAYFQKNLMMLSQPKHRKPPRSNPSGPHIAALLCPASKRF